MRDPWERIEIPKRVKLEELLDAWHKLEDLQTCDMAKAGVKVENTLRVLLRRAILDTLDEREEQRGHAEAM